MRTRVRNLQAKLVASYWFLPTVMCLLAAIAAGAALSFGPSSLPRHRWLSWVSVNTPDGARELLSTIASSTVTVAGVIFSITVLALSFASSQYGPRLLRNFMRDRPSQVVLGAFLSTYVYCLLVLRTVGIGGDEKLPHIAIAGALGLGIASMAVLIFFIHHLARAMQVASIVDAVGCDFAALRREFLRSAQPGGSDGPPEDLPPPQPITSEATGRVQALAREDLLGIAVAEDCWIEMAVAPGDFVGQGFTLARARSGHSPLPERVLERIRAAVVIGIERTNEQDLEFPLDQLAEIAVRALSPGTNDPFTALLCIDQLGAGLGLLAEAPWPAAALQDGNRRERVRLRPITIHRLLHRAFAQILHYGGSNPAIARQVLKALVVIARRAAPPHRRELHAFAVRAGDDIRASGVSDRISEFAAWRHELDARLTRPPGGEAER